MTNQSNILGRAYEFKCIKTLYEEIAKVRPVVIKKNDTYIVAKECWDIIDEELRQKFHMSSLAAVNSLIQLEPIIIQKSEETIVLKMQKDSEGEIGDVRDIIVACDNINYEIGLSIKHNHFAVKHSRLSRGLDFGEKWFRNKMFAKLLE